MKLIKVKKADVKPVYKTTSLNKAQNFVKKNSDYKIHLVALTPAPKDGRWKWYLIYSPKHHAGGRMDNRWAEIYFDKSIEL